MPGCGFKALCGIEVKLTDSGQYLAFDDDIRNLRFLRSGYALEDSIGIHRTLQA